jgi:hypothetical protein
MRDELRADFMLIRHYSKADFTSGLFSTTSDQIPNGRLRRQQQSPMLINAMMLPTIANQYILPIIMAMALAIRITFTAKNAKRIAIANGDLELSATWSTNFCHSGGNCKLAKCCFMTCGSVAKRLMVLTQLHIKPKTPVMSRQMAGALIRERLSCLNCLRSAYPNSSP